MMRNTVLSAAALVIGMLAAVASCSRSNTTTESQIAADSSSTAGYYKLFDPSSLKEVTDFKALPQGIRSHYDPSGVWFQLGGLSSTSALVANEVGDFVPKSTADAFVQVNSRWIKVKSWDVRVAHDWKLSELVKAVQYMEEYSRSTGLTTTLSRLNLANPIVDLDRNISLDKNYFIGLCEPPGHTPGVADADEPLVHTPAHGLWCLPGSGDPITTDDYAKAMEQARAYASKYNAELVRRIRRDEVK